MSQLSSSASLVSFSESTTDGSETLTPTASTANLIPDSAASGSKKAAAEPGSVPSNAAAPSTSASKPPAPAKDYESAFATLSSSYGWGGHAPKKAKQTKEQDKKKDKKDKKGKKKDKKSSDAAAAAAQGPSSGVP